MKLSHFGLLMGLIWPINVLADKVVEPFISVQGSASQSVEPDELVWRLAVRNQALDTLQVAKDHHKTVAAVITYLKKQGIKEKDIRTTHMQLSENKEYRQKQWQKEGFFASSSINFTLKDLDQYTELWQGLAKKTAVSMNGFSFSYSNKKELFSQLQLKALTNGRDKAKLMANQLNMSIGDPLVIEEMHIPESPVHRAQNLRAMAEMDQQPVLAAGQIKFVVSVRIKFAMAAQ